MESAIGFIVVSFIFVLFITDVKGEWLRCFCTEAGCVQTNYMCKTQLGSCYSRLTFDPRSGRLVSARHGCDDGGILLPWEKSDTCRSRSALVDEDATNRDSDVEEDRAKLLLPLSYLTEQERGQEIPSISETETENESDWEFTWKGRRRHQKPLQSFTKLLTTTIETESSDEFPPKGDYESKKVDNQREPVEGKSQLSFLYKKDSKNSKEINSTNYDDIFNETQKNKKEIDTGDNRADNDGDHLGQEEQRIVVSCCNDDMCNYIKDGDGLTMERAINRSDGVASTNQERQRTNSKPPIDKNIEHLIAATTSSHYHYFSDLWFKMAVCIVTIVGAAILVVIVVSAMRMLRTDKRSFRRQQSYCDCPHHVIDAILVAGDVSSKQQLLFPVADSSIGSCGGSGCSSSAYYKSPLSSPSSVEPQGIV